MKIDTNGIADFFDKPQARQPDGVKPLAGSGADVSVGVKYAWLIDRAKQAPLQESNAVRHGRRLLLSGELESTETARAAAENILKFGI